MYIDCFNVCSESIKSCCATLQGFDVSAENRKIAVIGGENALGENSYSVNFETGSALGDYKDIDEFYFMGPKEPTTAFNYNYYGNGKAVYEGAKTSLPEEKLHFVDEIEELAKIIRRESKPGDAILFKGIFRLPLFAAIDRAFGTSYVVNNANFKGEPVEANGFTGTFYPEIDGINVTKFKGKYKDLIIPGELDSKKLLRVDETAFSGKNKLKTLTVEEGVVTIGERAFEECKNLEKVVLAKSVLRIENSAFHGCQELKEIELPGVEDIGSKAFRNCKQLKQVVLSSDCQNIAEDAFDGCSDELIIIAPAGSYGAEYAKNKNFVKDEPGLLDKIIFWKKK